MDAETVAIITFLASVALIVVYVLYRRYFADLGYERDEQAAMEGGGSPIGSGGLPVMVTVVTLAILGVSLWIIVSQRYDADTKKWAFASTASILSFWLGTAVPKN